MTQRTPLAEARECGLVVATLATFLSAAIASVLLERLLTHAR